MFILLKSESMLLWLLSSDDDNFSASVSVMSAWLAVGSSRSEHEGSKDEDRVEVHCRTRAFL